MKRHAPVSIDNDVQYMQWYYLPAASALNHTQQRELRLTVRSHAVLNAAVLESLGCRQLDAGRKWSAYCACGTWYAS